MNNLLEKKWFIWGCAFLVFSGLLALKNTEISSKNLPVNPLERIVENIFKPSPSPTPLQLQPAPETVKAVYLTGWSAGNQKKINEIINLAEITELNGVIIDIKDYAGKIFFETDSQLIKDLNSTEIRIPNFKDLIKKLHEKNIYVSARIAVFQDVWLAEHRSDLAVKNNQTNKIWRDRKNLAWVDPASKEVWDYNLEIAKQAIKIGVDEVNFDYIRFPSDGNLELMSYPFYNAKEKTKAEQIRQFFEYLHENLKDEPVKLSADLFGLAAINTDDLGIGQVLEYALPYFDYVSPMVYPSHYASGFLGYKNPALYPYEVIDYSMEKAQNRISKLNLILNPTDTASSSSSTMPYIKTDRLPKNTRLAQLRPWLQVFDLGAVYTPEMIRRQIQAANDNQIKAGWYLWNPSNIYNPKALLSE